MEIQAYLLVARPLSRLKTLHALIRYPALIAVMLLVSTTSIAQLPRQSLRFDNLGIADGLSQSTVMSMLQDHLGYMWFATDDGINRYDGYRFSVFRHERNQKLGLPPGEVVGLHEDALGTLWAIGELGIGRYKRDSGFFFGATFSKPLTGLNPLVITEAEGYLYFSGKGSLYRLNIRTAVITPMQLDAGRSVELLCGLPDGRLLLRDPGGLFSYHPASGVIRRVPVIRGGTDAKVAIAANAQQAWLAGPAGVCLTDLKTGQAVKYIALPGINPTCCIFDGKGQLWIGTIGGLIGIDTSRMTAQIATARPEPFSLAGNDLTSLCTDRSGVLWIGTNDGGLSRKSDQKFKFGMIQGLAGRTAIAMAEDNKGDIWLGTEAGNISIYNPDTRTLRRCDQSTGCKLNAQGYILSLLSDAGIMYCGHSDGIDAISMATGRMAGKPLSDEGATIKKLLRDARGGLWALGAKRLYRYDPAERLFLPVEIAKHVSRLQNIVEDNSGTLWIGANNTLLRYDPATRATTDYGAKYPTRLGNTLSMALCKDGYGAIWIGVSDVGLLRYDAAADSFREYGRDRLPNKTIYAIAADTSGGLWLTTNAGVSRYDAAHDAFTHFNTSDGLLSNEGIGRAALRDSRGNIWLSNTAGVNFVDPAHIPLNTVPPIPRITGFKVFDKEVLFENALRTGGLHLRQAQNYFTLEYSAMDFTQPGDNSYRIMLEGFDKDWRPLSKANSVSYTNLNGGQYTFRLMAYNSDGVPAAAILELPIYIAPHFYKTWWFYLLTALVLIGSAWAFYRYRINVLKKELHLRNAIASDLHDDVGSTLSSIKMLTTMLRPRLQSERADVGEAIDAIHHRAGTTLEAMSDIVWSINPKNDAGEHLVLRMKSYAAELFGDTEMNYAFRIGEGLDRVKFRQHERKEVYLIYKEALNNALKYAAASRIDIAVRRVGASLLIEVADDGVGFSPDACAAYTSGGNGLKNMRSRATQIGGALTITSAPGKGTRVTLTMPIPHSR